MTLCALSYESQNLTVRPTAKQPSTPMTAYPSKPIGQAPGASSSGPDQAHGRRVLVLGANGRFGRAAVDAFAAAGWQVIAQVRRAPVHPWPKGVEVLEEGVLNAAELAAALAAASNPAHPSSAVGGPPVLVHAINPAYTRWDAEAMPALKVALEVAQLARAHVMLPGNVYNFGREMPERLHEGVPFNPSTPKGALRVAMEQAMARVAQDNALPATVIRAGDFLGPGSGTWLDLAIAKGVARGRLVYPGPLKAVHAWAYLPDLASAFVEVASRSSQLGLKTLHFEGHSLTGDELIEGLQQAAGQLGVRPKKDWQVAGMPWALMGALGWLRPMWREVASMSYLWSVPHRLSGEKLQAFVGKPLTVTPIQIALHRCLQDLVGSESRSVPQRAVS